MSDDRKNPTGRGLELGDNGLDLHSTEITSPRVRFGTHDLTHQQNDKLVRMADLRKVTVQQMVASIVRRELDRLR